MPKINDSVRLLSSLPSEGLVEGDIGVIVAEFLEPEVAYEVEFCSGNGATAAQVALRPEQIFVLP